MIPIARLIPLSFVFVFLPAAALAQTVPPGIPQITTAPTSVTRPTGVSSTLTVTASGNATLTYQWLRGTSSSPTVEIAGATGASYTLTSPTTADTAYYSVRVSNSLGSITTTPVLVTYQASAGALASAILPTVIGTSTNPVHAVIPADDGSFVFGGTFQQVTPVGGLATLFRGLVRIKTDGAFDLNFVKIYATSGVKTVSAMIRDTSGRILIGGDFDTVTTGGPAAFNVSRKNFARILADGTLDQAFASPFGSVSTVNSILVEPAGTILVGGFSSNVTGLPAGDKYLIRIDGTTGLADSTFTPAVPAQLINALHLLAGGKILVGHANGMERLNGDGTLDSGFNYAGGAGAVSAIHALPSGDFLIGRSASTMLKINANGALVTPFPSPSGTALSNVTEFLALPSGKIAVGGSFYNPSGRFALITENGTTTTGIDFGTAFSNTVNALALDGQNRLWIGGQFNSYKGITRDKLACITTEAVTPPDPGTPTPDAYTQLLITAGIAAERRGTADDPDGDGSTNLEEFNNGTGPADGNSFAYRLTTAGVGASVTANPAAAGGVYAPNTSVELTVTPNAGLTFLGWANGGSGAADPTLPLNVVMNQNRNLTAYAGLPLGDSLDAAALTWSTGGHVLWAGAAAPSHDGVDAVSASGLAQTGQEAWVETPVTLPGTLSLRWRLISAVTNGTRLQILKNGALLQELAATGGAFNLLSTNLTGNGPATLRFRLLRETSGSPTDSASLDLFSYVPFSPPALLPPADLTQTSVTLGWNATSGASYYELELATNATFTTGYRYFYRGPAELSQPVSGLVAGTTYYYRVTARSAAGLSAVSSTTFETVGKDSQTIDFPQPAAKTFGEPPFALSATASSGLAVAFEIVSGPGSVAGGNLTLTGAGDLVIRATQAGNGAYFSATPVERTLSVAPAAQTLTFTQPPDLAADPLACHALAASASSGLPITFTVESGPAVVTDGVLQVTGTGLVRLTASQAGNADYLAAAPVTREFTAVTAPAAARLKLSGLGKLPGGYSSAAEGISGDGSVIVGWATNSTSDNEAFRGSPAGITALGDLPGGSFTSWANAVSQDGSVVVGYGRSASGTEAFRWTSAGMVGLGDLPGGSFNSWANAVSQDGSVVVGMGQSSFNEAFRWTQAGGMVPFGMLPGGNQSEALGVSGDGNTVVGVGTATGVSEMAFRWTQAGGLTALGDLPGGETRSRANAISADGLVVVGQSTSARGREAFRWTAAGGMVGLGDLPGGAFESEALAVSADGSVVVGRATGASDSQAFVWDAAHGLRGIRDLLTAAGLATGRKFYTATGISADGRFATGTGTSRSGAYEAWLLDLNAPFVPATVALLWTEDLPQTESLKANSVLRMSYDNGTGKTDLATQIGGVEGGFNGVEYADGKILVPNQAKTLGTRVHHPAYSSRLVTNLFGYDLDARPGELWRSNGNDRQIFHSQPSGSPTYIGGVYDDTYTPVSTTNVGRFAFAIQAVDSTVYFSNPSDNPTGIFKMNADGTNIAAVHTAGSPVVYDFEVVGGMIYFCNIANNSIQRVNTDGSGLVTLVANADFPNGIDVTADGIYWTEWQNGRIRRSDLNGGNVTELITDLNAPRGVVVMPLSFVVPSDPLTDFLANAGVPADKRGPNDDPDNDGWANLMEYALDLNPNGSGGAFTGSAPTVVATPTLLQFTYRRVRTDVTYVVETSPTMAGGTWTAVGVTQGTPAGDGTTTASIPITPGSRFLRLSVTR